jgi:hypothetical protein
MRRGSRRPPIVLLAVAVVVASCCTADKVTQISTQTQLSPPEPVRETNYEIGKRLSAAVGEKILFEKDYTISSRETGVRPSADLILDADAEDIHLVLWASRQYPLIGKLMRGGHDYQLVEVRDVRDPDHPDVEPATFLLPINKDGEPLNVVIRTGQLIRVQPFREGAFLRPTVIEHTDSSHGFVDYDFLYGGTNGRTFKMTYREYSRDNLVTPEFTRDLAYPNSAEPIYLRTNIKLRILEVTSEGLVYSLEPSNNYIE